jgi:hypothetical protein
METPLLRIHPTRLALASIIASGFARPLIAQIPLANRWQRFNPVALPSAAGTGTGG